MFELFKLTLKLTLKLFGRQKVYFLVLVSFKKKKQRYGKTNRKQRTKCQDE